MATPPEVIQTPGSAFMPNEPSYRHDNRVNGVDSQQARHSHDFGASSSNDSPVRNMGGGAYGSVDPIQHYEESYDDDDDDEEEDAQEASQDRRANYNPWMPHKPAFVTVPPMEKNKKNSEQQQDPKRRAPSATAASKKTQDVASSAPATKKPKMMMMMMNKNQMKQPSNQSEKQISIESELETERSDDAKQHSSVSTALDPKPLQTTTKAEEDRNSKKVGESDPSDKETKMEEAVASTWSAPWWSTTPFGDLLNSDKSKGQVGFPNFFGGTDDQKQNALDDTKVNEDTLIEPQEALNEKERDSSKDATTPSIPVSPLPETASTESKDETAVTNQVLVEDKPPSVASENHKTTNNHKQHPPDEQPQAVGSGDALLDDSVKDETSVSPPSAAAKQRSYFHPDPERDHQDQAVAKAVADVVSGRSNMTQAPETKNDLSDSDWNRTTDMGSTNTKVADPVQEPQTVLASSKSALDALLDSSKKEAESPAELLSNARQRVKMQRSLQEDDTTVQIHAESSVSQSDMNSVSEAHQMDPPIAASTPWSPAQSASALQKELFESLGTAQNHRQGTSRFMTATHIGTNAETVPGKRSSFGRFLGKTGHTFHRPSGFKRATDDDGDDGTHSVTETEPVASSDDASNDPFMFRKSKSEPSLHARPALDEYEYEEKGGDSASFVVPFPPSSKSERNRRAEPPYNDDDDDNAVTVVASWKRNDLNNHRLWSDSEKEGGVRVLLRSLLSLVGHRLRSLALLTVVWSRWSRTNLRPTLSPGAGEETTISGFSTSRHHWKRRGALGSTALRLGSSPPNNNKNHKKKKFHGFRHPPRSP